jgi:hypothetical protein
MLVESEEESSNLMIELASKVDVEPPRRDVNPQAVSSSKCNPPPPGAAWTTTIDDHL